MITPPPPRHILRSRVGGGGGGIPVFYPTDRGAFHPLVSHPRAAGGKNTLCGERPLRQIRHRVCSCLLFVRLCRVPQVCQHPNSRMREWGAEALTALIKASLAYKHDPPLALNQVGKAGENLNIPHV